MASKRLREILNTIRILLLSLPLLLWMGSSLHAVESTAIFWAYDWGFFQKYYQVPAMLRATGTHAYIFSSEDTVSILSIASNPNNSAVLATTPNFVTSNGDTHFMYRSLDGGLTWTRMSPITTDAVFTSLVVHPTPPTAIFLAAAPGLGAYWSVNDGTSWSNKNADLGDLNVVGVAISPALGVPYRMYAGTHRGIYSRGNLPFQTWSGMPWILAGDDFEDDSVGVVPSGWSLMGTPTPNEFIVVDSTYSLSSPHSLMLHSANQGGNTVTAQIGFSGMTEVRWFFSLFTDSLNTGDGGNYQLLGNGGTDIAVSLARDGDELSIVSPVDTTEVGTIKPNVWYSIEVFASLTDSVFSVLMDGDTAASQVPFYSSSLSALDAMAFQVNPNGYTDWVDDVSVNPIVTQIAGDPDSINWVTVGTTDGVFQWSNVDSSWTPINTGLTNREIQFLTVDPEDRDILYSGTSSGIFKSLNGGGSWTAKNTGITNLDVRSIAFDPNTSTTLYAGTEGGGVYQSTNGGDFWTSINSGFSNWGVPPFVHEIPSLTVVSPDTLFAGTRHGIFRTTDGGQNWTEENTGVLRTFIKDTAVIDSILEIFDIKTPKDANRGVYEIVNGAFGNEPDVDGDSLIYIFLLDIPQDPTVPDVFGYFDIENQYLDDTLHPNSNEHEILYLDYLDINYTNEVAELSEDFQRMIHWNNDPDEEEWVILGMSEFAKFLTGAGATTLILPAFTSLTENHPVMTNLWIDYLFENYGGLSGLREIVSDSLSGFDGINSALDSLGYSEDHVQIFKDFAFAALLDDPRSSLNGGRYGFDSLQVSVSFNDSVNFATNPIVERTTPHWSLNYFRVLLSTLGDTLLFNGSNTNTYSVQLMERDTTVIPFNLDQTNDSRVYIDPTRYTLFVQTVVAVVSDTGGEPAFVLSNDLVPPSYVRLGVFQNAMADRFLDLYVFSQERLFEDVKVETPVVTVTQNSITQKVSMETFLEPGTDSIFVIYKGDYSLSASGATQIVLKGEDNAGNDIPPETTGVSVQWIEVEEGGEIASLDESMRLAIPKNSLAKNTYLTVFTFESPHSALSGRNLSLPDGRTPLGSAYQIGPTGLSLKKPSLLTIHIEEWEDLDPSLVGIYRVEGEEWVYRGGILEEGSISMEIELLGTYQVLMGPHPPLPSLPKIYSLSQNIPNPMGGEALIRYQLPKKSSVSLKVHNVMGQVVKTFVKGEEDAGYKSVPWRGDDDRGRRVANGVYFYTLEAGNFKKTRKLVLLK